MSATSMNMHIDKTRRYILLFGIYYLIVRVYLKHFVGKDLFDLSVFANQCLARIYAIRKDELSV